jgi:fructose-1,6-bisphosphatase/inositol monophosphatase family enzyme
MTTFPLLDDDLSLAQLLVQKAGQVALSYRGQGKAENKGEGLGSPVTVSDRKAEEAMDALLKQRRPDDGVRGEEGALRSVEAKRQWLIDPLDGTLLFTRGLEGWTSAAVLLDRALPIVSAICEPESRITWSAAYGLGATAVSGNGSTSKPLRVSSCTKLEEAVLHLASHNFHNDSRLRAFQARALASEASACLALGAPSISLCLLAEGRLDAWAGSRVKPWDWYPGAFLVKEAGGYSAIADDWYLAAAAPSLLEQMIAITGSIA